jgi:hypothetical protein
VRWVVVVVVVVVVVGIANLKTGKRPIYLQVVEFCFCPFCCSIKLFLFCFVLFCFMILFGICVAALLLLLPEFQRKDGFVLNLIKVGVWL